MSAASDATAAGQSITLENRATGFSATVTTNAQGRARFNSVPAADGYSVSVDKQTLADDIRLRANETRAVAVALPLESVLAAGGRYLDLAPPEGNSCSTPASSR